MKDANEHLVTVEVRPNKKTQSLSWDVNQKVLTADLTSAPEKGKANKELLKMLKKVFRAEEVSIISGFTSRTKKVKIRTKNFQKILNTLAEEQ